MKKFLVRLSIFLIGIVSIVITYHVFFNLLYNSKDKENTVFIWGDSQAYQGIDLERLSEKSGLNVYSAAKHGAGVYDFLVFAKNVPEKCNVLVAISKPAILRRKDSDYNMSGLNISALCFLYMNNYSIPEINKIIVHNISNLKELFVKKSYLYPLKNELIISETFESIKKVYKEKPYYFQDKINLYTKGLEILVKKGCKINLISFSYEKTLEEVEKESSINELKSIPNIIMTEFKYLDIKTVNLHLIKDKRVFYDFTHLNEYGAAQVSDFLIGKIIKKRNHFLIIN